MYYHTAMRYVALSLLALVLLSATPGAGRPQFVLRDVLERDWGIERLADWRTERLIDGIGWQLGTVSRGDGSVMQGGYTVIHPAHGEPFVLQHCYVLAAFDLLASGYLAVTVRDPEYYWPGYDYQEGVADPVEIVWFSAKWDEEDSLILGFTRDDYPDDFILAPDQRKLIAILHPVDVDDAPATEGQYLVLIDLRDGSHEPLLLPEVENLGHTPASWWPVRMQWSDDGDLLVQAGKQLRIYKVQW